MYNWRMRLVNSSDSETVESLSSRNSRSREMPSTNLLMIGCILNAYKRESELNALGISDRGAGVQFTFPSVYMRPFTPHHAFVCLRSLFTELSDTAAVLLDWLVEDMDEIAVAMQGRDILNTLVRNLGTRKLLTILSVVK